MVFDLRGQVFNRVTIISFNSLNKYFQSMWNCKCTCGNEFVVSSNSLKRGLTKSCGCLKRETNKANFLKHGEAYKSKEYTAWHSIKMRCCNPKNPNYKRYGGRGITMCDRWLNSYKNFLTDMGRAPSAKHSVDREKNDGNYEPGNCRWATTKEQANNRSRNRNITINGITKNLGQWCDHFKLNRNHVSYKFRIGFTADQIFDIEFLNKEGR